MLPNIPNKDGDKTLMVECSCAGYHYLEATRWDKNSGEVMLAFVDYPKNFWHAIKWYFKHRSMWVSEIVLTKADQEALKEMLPGDTLV